ncbi:hypothetical protein MASR2M17_04410 [Aminivibrio sp.]
MDLHDPPAEAPLGTVLLFVMFLSTWLCDVAAYLIGSLWGRTSLCENVAPKKTWEDFSGDSRRSPCLGGSGLYHETSFLSLHRPHLQCSGQLGDLAESVIKRETGVKDSGKIIPGHGGILDRFDSVLINGLLVYVLFGVILR